MSFVPSSNFEKFVFTTLSELKADFGKLKEDFGKLSEKKKKKVEKIEEQQVEMMERIVVLEDNQVKEGQ